MRSIPLAMDFSFLRRRERHVHTPDFAASVSPVAPLLINEHTLERYGDLSSASLSVLSGTGLDVVLRCMSRAGIHMTNHAPIELSQTEHPSPGVIGVTHPPPRVIHALLATHLFLFFGRYNRMEVRTQRDKE